MASELTKIERLDLEDARLARQLLELQLAAYSLEAELIGSYEIPPLKDNLATLQNCGEIFYGYLMDGRLAGAISYKRLHDLLDIHRLVVSPAYLRQGIAAALLNHLRTVEPGVTRLVVSTGSQNFPAVNLYLKHGFKPVREQEILPGLPITHFEKHLRA